MCSSDLARVVFISLLVASRRKNDHYTVRVLSCPGALNSFIRRCISINNIFNLINPMSLNWPGVLQNSQQAK